MPDLTPGTQLPTSDNPFSIQDLERAKFNFNNGTVSVRTSLFTGNGTAMVGTANALPVTLNTLIAGEDLTNNVTKVEERFSYYHHVGTAGSVSGTIKTGAGFLHTVDFGGHTSAGTYAFYDSVGTSTSVIAIVTPGATLPPTKLYDVSFATGLTVVSGSVCDLTFSYR